MTVKKLKEILATMPDDMDVFVAERKTEFSFGLVNSAYVKQISFAQETDGEVLAEHSALVLDEE